MANTRTYKMLLVDDDKFLLEMYANKFTKSGVEVEIAMNGQEALDKLKDGEKKFDVLILDIVMPGMDGLELLHNIRKENLAKDSVIVMLSNQNNPQDIEKAKLLKVNGYIVKATMIPSEVVTEVFKVIEQKK